MYKFLLRSYLADDKSQYEQVPATKSGISLKGGNMMSNVMLMASFMFKSLKFLCLSELYKAKLELQLLRAVRG